MATSAGAHCPSINLWRWPFFCLLYVVAYLGISVDIDTDDSDTDTADGIAIAGDGTDGTAAFDATSLA